MGWIHSEPLNRVYLLLDRIFSPETVNEVARNSETFIVVDVQLFPE